MLGYWYCYGVAQEYERKIYTVYDIIKKEIVFMSRIKVKGNHGTNVIVRLTATEKY
ncbi:MAG: hypothetical protein ACRC76_07675 [Proteocatella sp.]